MRHRVGWLAGAAVLLAPGCADRRAAVPADGPASPFAVAAVHFEQNATDGDVEVVFEVKGVDDGLTSLTVTAPDGRTVLSATSPDTSTLGVRQYRFESPEPTDIPRLQAAYPEGAYRFTGTTAAGERYAGEAMFSHRLPATPVLASPADDAEDVPVVGLRLRWTPDSGAVAYVVTIEETDLTLSVTLPGTTTTFAVPDGVLRPAREYTLAIGARLASGNATFIETSFATAGRE